MAGARNPWEENYGSNDGQDTGAKPWEQAYQQPEAPKSRTLGAVANDTVIEVANAAAGGVSSAANFIKSGNAVSGWIDKNIVKAGEDSQSDVTKAAKQQFRDEVENADGVMGELGAVGKYVVQNPLLSAAQAAGSFVGPGMAVKAVGFAGKAAQLGAKGVERAGRAGGVAAGAAMAGGDAAGTAYELSKNAGATEDQAVDAGRQASVIPAIVGGVSGMFGAERLLAGAKGFAGGTASRALKTGASEAAQEGLEEGVTQYEGQRAAMPYDASIDPSKGVAAAAGMGAALGGITGAGTSLLAGRGPQPGGQEPAPDQPPAQPPAPTQGTGPTLALPAPDRGVIQVAGDGTARTPAYQAPGYVGDVTDVEPRAVNPVREQVAAAAEQGGALSSAALTAIDTGLSDAMQPAPEQAPPQISLEEADERDRAAYEQFFAGFDADPVVSRYFENDDDIPDFDAASNASEEDFLRALGATDEDIQDAIATSRQPSIAQSRPAVDAGPQAYEPAGARQGAGTDQASQEGQVNAAVQPLAAAAPVPTLGGPVGADGAAGPTPAVSDGLAAGGSGNGGAAAAGVGAAEPGAARPGGRGDGNPALTPFQQARAEIQARKQQEAANAQAAQTPAPAAAPVSGPAAAAPAVEAAGVDGDAGPTWPTMTPEQRRRSRLEREIATGMTNNGGVMAKLRPSAIEKRKQELAAMGDAGKLPSPGPAEPLSADGLAAQGQEAPVTQGAAIQGAAWDALDQQQRTSVLLSAGWRTNKGGLNVIGKRLLNTPWEKISDGTRDIIAKNSGQNQAQALDGKAQVATETVAPPSAPVRIGRDQTPLSEGGKPFKTRKAAGDAKKLQPMMRVVTVPGGYALAEKTPAQLAAEERAAKRLRTARTSPAGEPVPAHAFIAASGGLHMRHRNDLGVDGNPRIGNRRLFGSLNRGLSIEQATEMLVADGYLSEGASHNDAFALIKRSLTQPQYNADGIERIAQAEADAQFEDYLAAQEDAAVENDEFDPFGMADEFTAEELDEVGYTDADPALQAEVSALIAQAEAMDIDTFAILEDIARTYANATQDQHNAAARDALAQAIARSNQDGGSTAAQAAPAAEPTAEQGLTSSATDRFAVGRSLSKDQRRQVLASLVDVYKTKGAGREFKGLDGNGNERYGYVYSPDLFEKSDITGAMVRYHVTLPDGRIAHPSELFPDLSIGDVERMALEQDTKRNRLDAYENALKPFYSDFASANLMAGQGQVVIEKSGRFAIIPERTGAIGQARQNGWELASPSGQVSEQSAGTRAAREQQDGLTSYTAEEAAQRQEEAAQAAKAETARQRAADAAAAKEEDRKRIAQASVRAADTFELGQDPLDSLTGQGSIFDAPAPQAAPAAQPDTPKLTPAEAKSLMAWEDLGQKDGVKTHALTFYESQADKDAKRGRMIVAKVSNGDRSATAWMVDGEDKTFGMLAQAKKLAEEVGMAKAVADGYVEEGVAMFSSADSNPPAKPLSLDRVNQLVQEALSGIRGAPPVEVTGRPADVGLKVPAGSVGYGVTLRSGDIYVFQSAMGSDLDVFKTVFHELFHRGVRVLVPKGQYVQTMLDLAKGDSRIQQLAIEWKNTEMGQKQKDNLRKQGYTGAELTGQYEALAIEEALAAVAEEIKAEGKLGSKPKSMTIRFLANWLAKVADLAGMKKLAQGIRTMTYNEAERFVMSAISRSGEPVQAGRTDNMSSKQAAQAVDQTQTEAFKRWFDGPEVGNTPIGDATEIEVDGKQRPTRNSEGRLIHPTEEGIRNFWRWFGDSEVVDEQGRPLVVYRSNAVDSVLSGKAQIPEGGMDGLRGNAELVSNLLKSPTFRLEGLGGFDAPTQRVVLAAVRSFGLDPKILRSVVELVPVDMVNILAGKNLSSKSLFSNDAVLKELLSANRDGSVSSAVDVADALVSAVAGVTAKATSVSVDGVGSLLDGSPASGAGEVNVFLSTHGGKLQAVDATMVQQRSNNIGNRGAFDPANPDIRRSFAGQQAATADTMALATAQQRLDAGEDAETVRRDTGWFRGADGKWRFEINDADARLKDRTQWTAKIDGINAKRDAALQALWQAEEQRNDFLRARGESPSRISSETKKTPEFKALAKALKNAEAAAEKAQDAAFLARQGDSLITVGDVLSHPALFAAYPEIADVRVDINDSLPANNAAYSYELRAIELSGKSDAQQLLSTLLHEIQHGIQHIEGFAMGGPGGARMWLGDMRPIAEAEYRKLVTELTTPMTVQEYAQQAWQSDTVTPEIQRDYTENFLPAHAKSLKTKGLDKDAQITAGWRAYKKLAGEVEARNTQARQNLTDAQRRATPPSQTADVADSDVIVMFNGKVAMSAPTPANAAPDAAPQPPRTPAATIRAAINRAYGKLLGQLEAKGLVTLAQTEAQAIEAAAQARADKTGGDVAQIKRSLTAAMQGGTDLDVKRSNGAVQGFFDPQTGQSFLIADNLSAEAAPGVLMHEVGIHMAADGSMEALFNRAVLMLEAQKADPFMRAVQAKLDAAGETSPEEVSAYLVEAYENQRAQAPASVKRWLADLLATVKAWLYKKGIVGADSLTVADVAAVARANAKSFSRRESPSRAGGLDAITRQRGVDTGESLIFSRSRLSDLKASAIGNNGNFDPDTADIRFRSADMGSRAGMADLASKARDELNKTFNAPGKLSWWHKTVGTMYNLAERSPAFKPVFNAAQGFVDDVSYYATDAAELAPKLLPKLETWRDIAKRPITAADNAAVAKPVFEGTLDWARDESGKPVRLQALLDAAEKLTPEQKAQRLLRQNKISEGMLKAWQGLPLEQYEKLVASRYESQMLQAGIVWTPAELKAQFKLTDAQVNLYQEFRAATNQSLDTMARSDMLRFGGEDVKDLRDMVMDAKDAQDAAQILRDHLLMLAKENPDRAGAIGQLANGMLDRAARVQELQEQGYAPLSRFGKYTVDVVDANGKREYFGLFETAREANIMAMKMRKGYGQDAVTQGTLSDEEFKLLAGITPESLELFGNMLGLDSTGDDAQDQAFQEYLRRTKTNRSAMRRLIHRQGIAGYSEDVGRVLASFIYSNARQTSAGLHMGDLGEAITAIPKQQGELKDAAIQLSEYVKNPREEAQMVRGLLFAQYLGGSIASAMVNMSQPAAVTLPWLSQFGGAKQAAAELGRAAKNLASRGHRYEADLASALKHAEEEGTVSPQEVHQLQAQAQGSGSLRPGDGTRAGDALAAAGNALTRLSLAWGKVFGAAEQVNRRITFIAAYRVAKAQKMANPAAFAKKAVIETQFTYSKANKMKWGRGAVGATAMTFKTYSIAYLELLGRMWAQGGPEGKKAVLLALGMLMLMGGAGGLPFAEDAEDLADGLAQMMGYNINSKKAKQELLENIFGEAGAGFVERGITGLPGMPLDVSVRLGMGNLLPATGLFKEKTDHTRDVLEIVGPVGDLAKRAASGARSILAGDVGAGLLQMAPAAVRNAAKGADMASTGMYRDDKGYKVLDTSPAEAAMKFIGFQPASVSKVQESNYINQQAKNFYNLRAQEIRAKWARGIFEKDADLVAEARADLEDWNRKNPDQRIVVNMPAVLKRVREMGKSKDERIAATAPKAMRQQMREDAAKARAAL